MSLLIGWLVRGAVRSIIRSMTVNPAPHEAFVAHVLAHFNEILSEDDDLVARLANAEYESPHRRVKRIASRVLAETARVAVASAVTLAIVYKFKK